VKKKIDPGELTERISVVRISFRQDDTGSDNTTGLPVIKNAWAKVDDLSGFEDEETGRVVSVGVKLFTLRWHSELLKDYKNLMVQYRNAEYNVLHVKEVGRRAYVVMRCVVRE